MANVINPSDVIFVGLSSTHVAWYRCFLPAMALGCHWVGSVGKPSKLVNVTGHSAHDIERGTDYNKYKIIVLQQPRHAEWIPWILNKQRAGIKVLYEVDDDFWSVAKNKHHPSSHKIKRSLKSIESCMAVCDGMIVGTEHLATRFAKYNKNIWVCPNGIDLARYRLTVPKRENINIGWTGGIGHEESLVDIIPVISRLKSEFNNVEFYSIGLPYARFVDGVEIPFTQIDNYPPALANFDINIAPASNNNFFRAKGELKWVEPGALGIPSVVSPVPYRSVEHEVDGFVANSPQDFYEYLKILIENSTLRWEMGESARRKVITKFDIADAINNWIAAFEGVT